MNFHDITTFNPLSGYYDYFILIVRIIYGILFFYYGKDKIKNLKQNAKDFEGMGFKPGWLFGTPIALLETFGSIFIIVGFLFRITALLFALHMLTGTIWKITSTNKPFTDWSYDLLALSIAVLFLITGAGRFALTF